MDIAERLAQVGEEIQHVENDLRDRRILLKSLLETPVPGEPCRRRRLHARDGTGNKGPREEATNAAK